MYNGPSGRIEATVPASPMPGTGYERAFRRPFGEHDPAIGFPFVLSFDPIFAGSATSTNRAGVSPRASDRYNRGYHGNFWSHAN